MSERKRPWSFIIYAFIFPLAPLLLVSCGGGGPYEESFDSPGSWRVGDDSSAAGLIQGGVFDFLVRADDSFSWTTAGQSFSDGVYQVEATQVEGPLNNGYGMLIRVDEENDNFYLFEISGDGFVWIGRLKGGGAEESQPIINDWWYESSAIKQGLNQTNVLRVEAEGGNMIFFVNGQEVGRATDNNFSSGDIGLMVETLGLGGVRVQFDNFTVSQIER